MSRPGELSSSLQRLKRATSKLQDQWSETKVGWNDETARQFESQYLEPILPELRLLLAASAELEDMFCQMKQELE